MQRAADIHSVRRDVTGSRFMCNFDAGAVVVVVMVDGNLFLVRSWRVNVDGEKANVVVIGRKIKERFSVIRFILVVILESLSAEVFNMCNGLNNQNKYYGWNRF